MMCILFYLENIRSKKYTNKMWRNARRELLIMATKIKSKFKVGVALLCTLLMMISIIPTNIIGGWDVNAAGFTVYFNKSKYANDGGWGGATNIRVYAEFSDGTKIGPKDTDMSVVTTATDTIYSYTFTSKPSNFTLIYIDSSYNTSSKNYQEGTQWEGWPKSGQEWRQTQPVSLSDSDNNKCYYINGHSGNKKILAVDSSFVPPVTSIEGSTVGFVDMTGTLNNLTYTFSGGSQTETAKVDYASGSTITVGSDYANYTTINFYNGDTIVKSIDLTEENTENSTSYDSESTNTYYYGATTNKTTGAVVASYWGPARGTAKGISNKTLYFSKTNFPKDNKSNITFNDTVTPQEVTEGNAELSVSIISTNSNEVLSITDGTYQYRFFWDDPDHYDLVVLNGNLASVSGLYQEVTTLTVYYDATLSRLQYSTASGVADGYGCTMPDSTGKLYYLATGDGKPDLRGEMKKVGQTTINGRTYADGDLYYIDADLTGYQYVQFARHSYSSNTYKTPSENDEARGQITKKLDIPTNQSATPCFYADASDDVIYINDSSTSAYRDGYWGRLGQLRDAESYKSNKDVVKVDSDQFTARNNVFYVNSTFYDYYTDYELNGNNRKDYGGENGGSYRNWVPFRHFDQALSDYYQDNEASGSDTLKKNAMYVGHFQPQAKDSGNADVWGYGFDNIASTLNLYGWLDCNAAFQSNNNSSKDITQTGYAVINSALRSGSTTIENGKYDYVTQNILAANAIKSGNTYLPAMYGTEVTMPFFNQDFLEGNNSKNTVLGQVYNNVAFPFTKVDRDGDGVYYWSFDSAATTLHLYQNSNSANSQYEYYLKQMSQGTSSFGSFTGSEEASHNNTTDTTIANTNRGTTWSYNVDSASNSFGSGDGVSNRYGFFPLNDTSTSASAKNYNYGFGTKLEFDFALTADGNVTDKSGNSKPITFNFSGDDDVWVFIDGKLVLDIGGDHGRSSGSINFSKNESYSYQYTYKPVQSSVLVSATGTVPAQGTFVSKVKQSANNSTEYNNVKNAENAQVTNSLLAAMGIDESDAKAVEKFYSDTHTLTMFYMERGMWESNMKVQFNFPDKDELQVSKTIDTSDVAADFKDFFTSETFDFSVQNLATHYQPYEGSDEGEDVTKEFAKDFTSTTLVPSSANNTFAKTDDPVSGGTQGKVVKYNANYVNTGGQENNRLGTFGSDGDGIVDIDMDTYLEFKAYLVPQNGDTADTTKMYIRLIDSDGNYIAGRLSSQSMTTNSWTTLKINFTDMTETSGTFDKKKLQKISFEYDGYGPANNNNPQNQSTIYLDDFIFKSDVYTGTVGFVTAQQLIKDYGSTTGSNKTSDTNAELMPAVGALYTSSNDSESVYHKTDGNAGFSVQNGETVTFANQFRRGSYISLNENLSAEESNLFTTTWAVYESGTLVSNSNTNTRYVSGSKNGTLTGEGTGIDDGRKELVLSETDFGNYKNTNNDVNYGNYIDNDYSRQAGSSGATKPDANTLVFRSYTTDADENTDQGMLKLAVKYANKVNTTSAGTFSLSKRWEGDAVAGTYTFYVVFSNIGGLNLADSNGNTTVTKGPYKVTFDTDGNATWDKQMNFDGIPVGTTYTIHELKKATDSNGEEVTKDWKLESVTIDGEPVTLDDSSIGDEPTSTATGIVRGTVSSSGGAIIFTNAKKATVSLNIQKRWADVYEQTDLPQISLGLQSSSDNGTTWTTKKICTLNANTGVVTVTHDGTGNKDTLWKYTVTGLDKYDENNPSKPLQYRLVELYYDSNTNAYMAYGDGATFNELYKVSYGDAITPNDEGNTLTVTNTLVPPEPIIMPETGGNGQPFNYVLFGSIAVTLAGGALLIYRRKLKYAYHRAQVRGGDKR